MSIRKIKPINRISRNLAMRQPDPAFLAHFGRNKEGKLRTPVNNTELKERGISVEKLMENGDKG